MTEPWERLLDLPPRLRKAPKARGGARAKPPTGPLEVTPVVEASPAASPKAEDFPTMDLPKASVPVDDIIPEDFIREEDQ